jgi:hypothetical protein
LFIKPPIDPYKRLLWSSGLAFLINCIFVPLLAGLLSARRERAFLEWGEGFLLWGISLMILVAFLITGRKFDRPSTYYLMERLPSLPMGIVLIDGGLRLIEAILGFQSMLIISAGLLLGLSTVPFRIKSQRQRLRQALEDGYLQESLDRDTFSWDPKFDNDRWVEDERMTNPGLLRRVLFWLGPAIGMALSDLIGRSSALVLAGACAIYGGYFVLGSGAELAMAHALELKAIEEQIGHSLHIMMEGEMSL